MNDFSDFRRLMSARFFFTFAVQMQAVVIGWRMYELTHDPLYLGLIGLAEAIPALSLALFAGYIVDRSRPVVVYRRVILGSLLSGAVFLVSQLPQIRLEHRAQIIALFASSFITGCARGFSQPSMYAIVPRIISRENLSRASAWMTSALQIARIAGPATGGMIFGWLGILTAAEVVCAMLVIAQVALLLLKTRIPAPAAPPTRAPLREELLSGASFVFGHPILLPALSLDMISVLFGGVTALLPIYASDILMIGPRGLGALRAAPAVGAAITSFALTRFEIRDKAGPLLFTSVAGFGVCILVFGVSRDFTVSLAGLALSGGFDSISMVIRTTAVQLVSPDALRGRISAVNSIFIGSSNEIGEFESGVAARLMGTQAAVLFGGVVCLLTVGVAAVLSPTLRKMNLNRLASPL